MMGGATLTTAPLLEVRNLDLDYATARGTAQVLRQVNMTIPKNRIVGVVGESGSGKSTLASVIMRLLPANLSRLSGQVMLDGTDLLGLDQAAMTRVRGNKVAMIFQDPMTALNPVFTIETQMVDIQRGKFPGRSRRELRDRALDMMGKVGIPDPVRRITAYPHQFSGGMRQRIMIAMALLVEPDLLIADEPTTALDVTIEAQIIRLLEQIRENFSGSILFISHSLGVISTLCDEVVVMYAGSVVEQAASRDLFLSPRHPYTRALLSCEIGEDDAADAALRSIPGNVPDLFDLEPACIFAARCDLAEERCRRAVPPLREMGPGHRAACVLA